MQKIYALLCIMTITMVSTLMGTGKLPAELAKEFAEVTKGCALIKEYKNAGEWYSIKDYEKCIKFEETQKALKEAGLK